MEIDISHDKIYRWPKKAYIKLLNTICWEKEMKTVRKLPDTIRMAELIINPKLDPMSAGELTEHQEPLSYPAGRNVKWHNPFKTIWHFPKKLNRRLPCDLAISSLDIYPRQKKAYVQGAWVA